MRRWWIGLVGALFLTACGMMPRAAVRPTEGADSIPPSPVVTFTPTPLPSVPPTSTPTASQTSTPVPPPTSGPTFTPTTVPDPSLVERQVYVYPQLLVAGDRVSFDVVPLLPLEEVEDVEISIALPSGTTLDEGVHRQGFDQARRARFYWSWDTTGLTGTQVVTVSLALPPEMHDPDLSDNVLPISVTLYPKTTLAPPEPGVRWVVTQTAQFRLHYLTGSAAARDMSEVLSVTGAAGNAVMAQLNAPVMEPLDIYLLDRVVGQGGYATSEWVAISYVDRAYAPADLEILLKHELTHRLDAAIGCDDAPSLLREGLAVMIAGGHYWPASLPRKAATLPGTEAYIPLPELAEDFYLHQHEIGYLEAGALLVYVQEALGQEGVEALCRAASLGEGTASERLSTAFTAVGLGDLEAVERNWLRWLGALHPTDVERQAVESEIRYLEMMRAYQARYDRVANFRHGILFSPAVAADAGITADFVRDPDTPEALALELLLQLAKDALRRQRPAEAMRRLDAVGGALGRPPLWEGRAQDVLEIVTASLARGYEPYRLLHKPTQDGWFIYGLNRRAWPTQELLWAAQDEDGQWVVTGPQ